MQILIEYTLWGKAKRVTVYYKGDSWQLPYSWALIRMLHDIENEYKRRKAICEVWSLTPAYTLDGSSSVVYNIAM